LLSTGLGLAFFQPFDDSVEIRITGAKLPGQEITATFRDFLTVHQNIELAALAGLHHGFHAETLLDQGREPRDLDFIIPSGRAMDDFNFHFNTPQSQV
jgi:hypothetical protein